MKNLKVSSLFHWLYAAVMFLPILLLPVFMIYSHRHTIDSGSIQVPQNEVVDFNQLMDVVDLTEGVVNNNHVVSFTNNTGNILNSKKICNIRVVDFKLNNVYYFPFLNENSQYRFFDSTGTYALQVDNQLFTCSINLADVIQVFYTDSIAVNQTISFTSELFNFTQMFGSGNEPTIQQFNQYFPNDYYEYTLSKKVLLKDVSTITYNDTDIMSQATYQLYNATDKYFNISQFFGFENLWDYMVLNWFGGNVTIYLRIFWQLLTYWLVVSIAWLIFDLFMYVPKLAHRWLDRSAIE